MVCAALVLAASACSKSTTSGTASPGASGSSSPQGLAISVDNRNPAANEAFLSYFPATATVRPGATLTFNLVDSGEPHTVTFGTLADAAVNAYNQNQNSATSMATDAALPQLLPQGPGDAIPSAGLPCAITTGSVPTATACTAAQQTLSPFAGTEAYYNSGWLAAGKPFTLTLSSSIKPGSYHYLCLLHRESMQGTIIVAGPSDTVPPAATQEAAGQSQLQQEIAALAPAETGLAKGSIAPFVPTGPDKVVAGGGTQASNDLITEFGPKTVTTTVGGSITWYIFGPHTVSFAAPPSAYGIRVGDTQHINPQAALPQGGPGQTGPPGGPDPNAAPGIGEMINGGTFDGSTFKSSGSIISFPPKLTAYTLKFSKAGTYPYACLIHPGMAGTVVVQ
ncbi:MAG TPA: hypothetical protein VFW71_15785 [Actinomycetota bacterium]|nr:hypothetical protein [Actinomycetota bacterium]